MHAIGFVTIGQAPRNDIVSSMIRSSPRIVTIQHGALDQLDHSEILSLHPAEGEISYVTRLADGAEVLLSKSALMPHLQSAIDRTVAHQVSSIVVLCTGAFPELTSRVPIIFPDRILQATVDAMLPAGRLGVLMPHKDQWELMRSKWQTIDREMIGAVASPYSSSDGLEEIGTELKRQNVDMVVLDCMGFTAGMKCDVSRRVDVPVVLANRLVGRLIEEFAIGEKFSAGSRPTPGA